MADTDTVASNDDTVTLTEPAFYNGVRAANPNTKVPRALAEDNDWTYRENDEPDPATVPPAGNASLEEWRAFALAQPGVTEEFIEGATRDQLRQQYGS